MSFIGNVPAEAYSTVAKDTFSGNGSTTDFTLSIPATTNSVEVFVENVQQEPTDAYTIAGTTLSFTAAPVTGTDNIYVIHRGPAVQQVVPPAGVALNPSTVTATGDISTEGDLKVEVSSGGIYTITGTDTSSNRTLTLPDEAGTVLTSASDIVASQLPAGSVLQVLQTVKTDTFGVTAVAGTWFQVTGLTATITPSSTSSKILIFARLDVSTQGGSGQRFSAALYKGASAISGYIGDTSGSRLRGSRTHTFASNSNMTQHLSFMYLDSPSTTSATTYSVYISGEGGCQNMYVNTTYASGNDNTNYNGTCDITVMEIAG